MEETYGLPFDAFERYVPNGTPADIATILRSYIQAGCRSFSLVPCPADARTAIVGAGEVSRLLTSVEL